MAILVLATSGPHAEVGVGRPGAPLAVRRLGTGAERGRRVVGEARDLLAEAGVRAEDLEGVVVDVGPGSFTGVRVGVTAAKAIAWSVGRPAFGVPSLEALAQGAPARRPVVAVRDAGRGRLYWAVYGPREPGGRRLVEGPARTPAPEVLSALADRLLVGEEAPALLVRHGAHGDALATEAGAEAVLAVARPALESEGAAGLPHALVPLYLQASAPERRRLGEIEEGPRVGGPNDRPRN